MTEKENGEQVPSQALAAFEDVSEAFRGLDLSAVDASDWKKDEQNLIILRTLAQFHAETLKELRTKEKVIPYLLEHSDSLRSAIARNALAALEDVFRECPSLVEAQLVQLAGEETELESPRRLVARDLVNVLVLKSSSEKKFIAESAKKALDELCRATFTDVRANRSVVDLLLECANTSKNVKTVAIACSAARLSLNSAIKAGDEDATQYHLREFVDLSKHLRIVISLESGRSVEARIPCQQMIQLLYKSFGKDEFSRVLESYQLPAAVKSKVDSLAQNASPRPANQATGVLPRRATNGNMTVERPWAKVPLVKTAQSSEPSVFAEDT